MSKEIEELKEEVRAALQEFSEPEVSALLWIGNRANSSQIVRRVSPAVKFSRKEEEATRKIAKLKKLVLAEDPSTGFPKVLQDLRKPKESKMDKKFWNISEDMVNKVFSLEPGEVLLIKDSKGQEIAVIQLGGVPPYTTRLPQLNIQCPEDHYFVIANHDRDQFGLRQSKFFGETRKK